MRLVARGIQSVNIHRLMQVSWMSSMLDKHKNQVVQYTEQFDLLKSVFSCVYFSHFRMILMTFYNIPITNLSSLCSLCFHIINLL